MATKRKKSRKKSLEFKSEALSRRTAIICCWRAAARMRTDIDDLCGWVLEAIDNLPLEARVVPGSIRIPTSVTVRLPIHLRPPTLRGAQVPGIDPRTDPFKMVDLQTDLDPEAIPMALAATDAAPISLIRTLVRRQTSNFDCEDCNQAWRQDKPRISEECIRELGTPGHEFEHSRRSRTRKPG